MAPDSSVFRRQRPGWEFPRAVRAEGVHIWDERGRRLIDAAGGALVVNVGHGVAEIAEAMAAQAARLAYVHGSELTSEPVEALARALAARVPLDDARLFLVSGGSEATETAIKLARQIAVARGEPGRVKVIFRRPSYHGASLGALAVSGRPTMRADFEPMLAAMPSIPAPYPYRCRLPGCGEVCSLACCDALATTIEAEGPATVAAFIAEPVIGASAGAVVPPADYYRRIRETCDRFGVLFIADEVMTGLGRTGRWFGMDHWAGVRPDIVTTGKGLTSGYLPGGAVLARGDLVDRVQDAGGFHHGFTYSHHPVVAAVGLAVLRYLERHDLVARAGVTGVHLLARLRGLVDLPAVGDVRGIGLMAAVEVVRDRAAREPYPRAARMAQRIQAEALRRGVIVYASGGQVEGAGDLVMLGPPLGITTGQIDEVVDVLGDAIAAATREA
ncbi:MAG: aspartate aminotransferase family protein [Candidatus Rokubacteria bacterium]|nr:aspartate aminotransferase family protein [Candidatus Rokubacteria bacterium]MBI3825532.1 aspartate aminotransferase family protein [Candidatus Rokubacteria bacterium]